MRGGKERTAIRQGVWCHDAIEYKVKIESRVEDEQMVHCRWGRESMSFVLLVRAGCSWVGGVVVVHRIFAVTASPVIPPSGEPEVPRKPSSERRVFVIMVIFLNSVLVLRPPGNHILQRVEICAQRVNLEQW